MDLPSVTLIGGLPAPSGGVTVFLGRLVNRIGSLVDFYVLDQHAGIKEASLARRIDISPQGRVLRHLWIFARVWCARTRIVHFNYSSCMALAVLALVPKLGRRFVVTLHNGTQWERFATASAPLRWLVARGTRRADSVLALCADHEQFYRLTGLPAERVLPIKSHVPAPPVDASPADPAFAELRAQAQSLLIASGHIERSYQFGYVLDYVRARPGVAAAFFFYGRYPDQSYLAELEQAASDLPVRFYFHQSEQVFLAALACADAYVRPTLVDSWGIAVADAICMGIPAVASDVCERFPGARLCRAGDYVDFVTRTDEALANGSSGASQPLDASASILRIYQQLNIQ